MSFFDGLLVLWLTLLLWQFVGYGFGLLTRKELYSLSVIVNSFHLVLTVIFFFKAHYWWSHMFWVFAAYVDVKAIRVNYRKWKNEDDDDDDVKRRRREWVKNKLPKPFAKPLENPT